LPLYLSSDQIKSAVANLSTSRARKARLFDFLIIKRALTIKGKRSLPITESEPAFISALTDVGGSGFTDSDRYYYNPFAATEGGGKNGYRLARYASNGTNSTIGNMEWQAIVSLSDDDPRKASLKKGYVTNLPSFLFVGDRNKPLPTLADATIWYWRGKDLVSIVGTATTSKARLSRLTKAFTNEIGFTTAELKVVFGDQGDKDREINFSSTKPTPKSYLPYKQEHTTETSVAPTGVEQIPAQRPSAIRPEWMAGRLTLPLEPPKARITQDALLNALTALRADILELVDDLDEEVGRATKAGRNLNIDTRPLVHLKRLASRMGGELPPPYELLRIFHAGDTLLAYAGIVSAEWPDFLAVRFSSLSLHFGDVARQVDDWRALKAEHLTEEQVSEVPKAVKEFSEILASDDAVGIVDPKLIGAIADLLEAMTDPALSLPKPSISGLGEVSVLTAATEALGADLLNAMNNVLQRLSLAALWLQSGPIGELAGKSGNAAWKAFQTELPAQGSKLAKLMARIIVWAPATAAGVALAEKFTWFAPIAKLIAKGFAGL
jgi:hypothetical protein